MPKNNKPAPPQQSNLAEMWGKKRTHNVKENDEKVEEGEVIGDVKVDGMEVDVPVKPESCMHLDVHERESLLICMVSLASPVSNGKQPAIQTDAMEAGESPTCE